MDTATQETEADLEPYRRSNPALDMVAMLTAVLGKTLDMPLRPQDEALFEGTEAFRFGPDGSRQAWSIGDGPPVVLVHGYSGRGVQMATLARKLAAEGFRSIFFDAGGHGVSQPERIGFFTFINDTRDLTAHLDTPIHALVGHSAGGLAMMRARGLYGVAAEKYAVISAPLFPYVPLESMRARGVPEQGLDYIKAILSEQFQTNWSSLVSGDAYTPDPGKPLLAVYDPSDDRVRHTDAQALAGIWPDTRIVKPTGYGHNRILQAGETLEAVAEFLKA